MNPHPHADRRAQRTVTTYPVVCPHCGKRYQDGGKEAAAGAQVVACPPCRRAGRGRMRRAIR